MSEQTDYGIYGKKRTGKTTYARLLCWDYYQAGIQRIIYDPMQDNEDPWPVPEHLLYGIGEEDEFLSCVNQSEDCLVVVDEADEIIENRKDERFRKLITRGGHKGTTGHDIVHIAQRPAMVDYTVRSQADEYFIFFLNPRDAKELKKEIHKLPIEEVYNLEQLEFIHVGDWMDPVKKRIVF